MEKQQLMEAITPKEAGYLEILLSDPIKRIQEFQDVELTMDEIAEALIKAKAAKDIKLQYEKNQEARIQAGKEMMNPFTPVELFNYGKKFYFERFKKEFILDENNRPLVKKLAEYFTGADDFIAEGYSLDKGILIMGNVGTGKTDLMKFFQKNKKGCYRIVACAEAADDYSIYQDNIESVYAHPIEKPMHDPSVFYQKLIGCCFDDLGCEEVKNNFGNKKNVMADIIRVIYDRKNFAQFHITTNLNWNEIEEKYGSRIQSRMLEMFNVFILNGPDRRMAGIKS